MKNQLCALMLCLFAAFLLFGAGCSHRHEVRTSETIESSSGPAPDARSDYRREETKSVENEKSNECSGVLSCAVDVVGEIIAFPFKAVGALAGAIF